jgi:hypothetical protein
MIIELVLPSGLPDQPALAHRNRPLLMPSRPSVQHAGDEDNFLRIYWADAGGDPIQSVELNGFLGPDPSDEDDKADLEAAAKLDGKVLWLASHCRSGGKGKLRPSRWQIFETEVNEHRSSPMVRRIDRSLPHLGMSKKKAPHHVPMRGSSAGKNGYQAATIDLEG